MFSFIVMDSTHANAPDLLSFSLPMQNLCSSVESYDGFDMYHFYCVNRRTSNRAATVACAQNISDRMKMKWVKFDFSPKSIHERMNEWTSERKNLLNATKNLLTISMPMPMPVCITYSLACECDCECVRWPFFIILSEFTFTFFSSSLVPCDLLDSAEAMRFCLTLATETKCDSCVSNKLCIQKPEWISGKSTNERRSESKNDHDDDDDKDEAEGRKKHFHGVSLR